MEVLWCVVFCFVVLYLLKAWLTIHTTDDHMPGWCWCCCGHNCITWLFETLFGGTMIRCRVLVVHAFDSECTNKQWVDRWRVCTDLMMCASHHYCVVYFCCKTCSVNSVRQSIVYRCMHPSSINNPVWAYLGREFALCLEYWACVRLKRKWFSMHQLHSAHRQRSIDTGLIDTTHACLWKLVGSR